MSRLTRFLSAVRDRVTGRVAARTEPSKSKPAYEPGCGAPVRGRYDAAQTTDENRNHWAAADGMSANAAHSPTVRQILRNRSRYEAQNNGYCRGLLRTKRNDVVGTGPRLQVTLPARFTVIDPDFDVVQTFDVPEAAASAVEAKWNEWCDLVGLSDDLRVLVETGERDGECFAVMVNNPALPANGPQLDLRLYEGDQVATPDLWWHDPHAVDGIRFDPHGNPIEYHFLRSHPGDLIGTGPAYDPVPARAVMHWYDPERPNQARGVPALTAALPLYAQLRRYTLATLSAAEIAAMITGVMKTKLAPEYNGPPTQSAAATQRPQFDRVEFERGALLSLPEGWDASGFDAKQPVTGYGEFKKEVLTEAGAAGNVARNTATKSSAEYNYSSARLDHLPGRADATITRDRLRRWVLDKLFRAWLREALLLPNYLPANLPPAAQWRWAWQWDGVPSIDPVKDATADDIGLKNGTRTLSDVLSERGKSWEEHLRQKAREMALARKLEDENGLPRGSLYPITAAGQQAAALPPEEDPTDAEAEPAAAA
ncbi:phage portal protein [Gemmata sp. JC717]|uniref:phage portal protein n=1 Tax=Gemmata algarum TaxID=2975278 RepID=UPI0021BB54E8|nr:phage portal protein [Gemmata algarum]MDY3555312.1 phage portal protein [Gemmata algarum]